MAANDDKVQAQAKAGRQAALVFVATGLFWIAAIWIGGRLGLSIRTRALFDLIALAGFAFGLWMTYRAWRIGQG